MSAQNRWNRLIYKAWAPVYDVFAGLPVVARARANGIARLELQPGERVLLSGVGTGADLPLLPAGIRADGLDLSAPMLAKARARLPLPDREIHLHLGNAEALPFADESFDAAFLALILSVVGDPRSALRETYRVLRPGGRIVVLDKFLPAGATPSAARRLLNALVMRPFGTDINRSFSAMLPGLPMQILSDEPAGTGTPYRLITLRRGGEPRRIPEGNQPQTS